MLFWSSKSQPGEGEVQCPPADPRPTQQQPLYQRQGQLQCGLGGGLGLQLGVEPEEPQSIKKLPMAGLGRPATKAVLSVVAPSSDHH
ncbi:hypothetical protein SUZIE_156795 [Sciurus carolinensis]|uniref:Uncharacterized protein n=1 Tax=Sciurus carolinensis TaxID=30640 RepID=A0AA41MYH8_SCICA|nr:hypothetical protein [Sciurus carolinensis]